MLRPAIVHVGMHKTGTSAIQSALAAATDLGRYAYPDLGDLNHSLPLHQMYADAPAAHPQLRRQGVGEEDARRTGAALRASLAQQLQRLPSDVVPIFSAEYLSICTDDVLRNFQAALVERGYEWSVKAYVRSPAAFISSQFQQRLTAGAGDFDVERCYPRYRARLERFEVGFGRACIEYWPYDMPPRTEPDVVVDFAQRVGCRLAPPVRARPRNAALSLEAVGLLYAYRRHAAQAGQKAFAEDNLFGRALAGVRGSRFALAPALVDPVLHRQQRDINWMSERMGWDLRSVQSDAAVSVASEQELLDIGHRTAASLADELQIPRAARSDADLTLAVATALGERERQRLDRQKDSAATGWLGRLLRPKSK